MSKKMANKILAAVLSLGAAMSNGSTSSAMEKTGKKNEIQNSQRNEMSDYMKSGLGVLKENFSLKDLVYLLISYKIYGKLAVSNSLSGSELAKIISAASDADDYDVNYIMFYNACNDFIKHDAFKKQENRDWLLLIFVDRICKLLPEGIVKAHKIEVNNNVPKEEKLIINKDKEKDEEEILEIEADDSGKVLDISKLLRTLRKYELSYASGVDSTFWSDSSSYAKCRVLIESVSILFQTFTYDEIFDAIVSFDRDGKEEGRFYKFIRSLCDLTLLDKVDKVSGSGDKNLSLKNYKNKWAKCVSKANGFINFCEKDYLKIKKGKVGVKVEEEIEDIEINKGNNNNNENNPKGDDKGGNKENGENEINEIKDDN